MKALHISTAAVAVLVAAVSAVAFAPQHAAATTPGHTIKIEIRHQMHGCHTWAVGNSKFAAHQVARIHAGDALRFKNDDLMPHKLVKTHGTAVVFAGKPLMSHAAASVSVTFARAGVYTFKTVAGEDYVKGVMTTGEDNHLTLRVVVS
jgi:plastocyanin